MRGRYRSRRGRDGAVDPALAPGAAQRGRPHSRSRATPRARRRAPRAAAPAAAARHDRRATPTTRSPPGSIPASRTLNGEELLTWRNTATVPAPVAALPPLLQRLAQHALDVDARARSSPATTRSPTGPRRDWGWIDVTSIKLVPASGAPVDVTEPPSLHRARRWQRGRSHGGRGRRSTRRSRRARPSTSRSRGPRACRARSRAPARSATSTSSRSGSRRSASSRTAAGTAISSTPPPSSSPTSASTTCA